MSTVTMTSRRIDALHPLVAATAGAVSFAVAMTANELLGVTPDPGGAPATRACPVDGLGWGRGARS